MSTSEGQHNYVRSCGDKVRVSRLRWFGHVQRRDSEFIGRSMQRLELPCRRPRERQNRRFMDVVKEDMKLVGVKEEDAEDRVRSRQMICCRSLREQLKGKEDKLVN